MAITTTSVAAAELSAYNASKPLFLAKNALANYAGQETVDVTDGIGPETGVSAVWRICTGAYWAPKAINAVGFTDNGQNPLRAFDFNLNGLTAPWVGQTSSEFTGVGFAFTCIVDPTVPIDSIVIANHNFKDLQDALDAQAVGPGDPHGRIVVDVWFDTVNTFANALAHKSATVLWEPGLTPGFSAFTNERLVCFDLGSVVATDGYKAGFLGYNYRYTGVVYAQIRVMIIAEDPFGDTATTWLPAPQIGEVYMGPRRQLSRTPVFTSWEKDDIESIVGEFTSMSGVKTRYGISMGKSLYSPNWNPSGDPDLGTTDLYGLDDLQTLETFWSDCNYGSRPFFFVPDPLNYRNAAPFCKVTDADFPAQLIGGLTEREVAFEFEELSPYVREEKFAIRGIG